MKTKFRFTKQILSVVLCIAMLLTYLPPLSSVSVNAATDTTLSTSVADAKTLDDWSDWFTPTSSRYAGGVFIDKSVYTATEALNDVYFADVKSSLKFGQDSFGNENFMVALSALGSNSEIHGYSYTPTDTVIVLDASTSMGTGNAASSSIDDMVAGANEAVKKLLDLNYHNRVGVVIYNGSAQVLLPIDRYSSASGDILAYRRESSNNRIYVANGVKDGNGASVGTKYVAQAQGTYTQGGFYAATQEFLKMDTTIADDKIQGSTKRIPIMVFMSDGEPSYRTRTGSNTTVDKYNAATNENCDGNGNFQEDDITAFSTMLTAAWAEAEISSHYDSDAYFYTLGYALSAGHAYAHNVLDPLNTSNNLYSRFKGFADSYLAMDEGETKRFTGEQSFRVKRLSDPAKVTSLDYVDRYWQASDASRLQTAFQSIVDEIIIQSRYYSTYISGATTHQDGYISFTDEIGTHMEVKNIKGLYIGEGKLISGGLFAEFATTGEVKDYDSSWYSEEELEGFETEILLATSQRFGITTSDAMALINSARNSGYIRYTSPSDFSNFVAWYADEDSNYIAPYSETSTVDLSGANPPKYIVRSYFYMGDVMQNHVESSMLYMLVRVREDIETGRQIVDMNLPASLLPMVTYTISVEGDELTQENLRSMTFTSKKPISLLYEVGLDSEITPYNITEKLEGEDFRQTNGIYTFYTNRWRDDVGNAFTIPATADPHVFNHGIMNTTVTQFIPSLENERFYFTKNTQVLDSSYNVYNGDTKPSGNGYFTEHFWIETDGTGATLKSAYNPVSTSLLDKDSIIRIDGQEGWFIKKGSAEFYFGEEVHGEQAHTHKENNETETLLWSSYPHVEHHESEGHNGYHMLNYLGNNGRITATPAQGIKLTKTVDETVAGAPDTFSFTVKLENPGTVLPTSYPARIERANGSVENATLDLISDELSLELRAGDTAYITGIPQSTEYTVSEEYSSYYYAVGTNANGTVAEYTLSEVSFVNTPKGYGSLLVEKEVTHPFETISPELEAETFDITVVFTGDDLSEIVAPAGATEVSDGVYTFTLKSDDDILFTHIPVGVEYTVSENNIPDGYTLKTSSSARRGVVSKNTESQDGICQGGSPQKSTSS